jgi:DNA modification methylase
MALKRIILETSDQRKSALVESADLQGGSLSDWLEEQITVSLPKSARTLPEPLPDLTDPALLNDSVAILENLASQNWAFTDDDTRYLTHDLHPYPAKFIPQIPAHLISRLSIPGDIVFDPFGGSATTAVEAVRLRRQAISLDANPLSGLIGRVKSGFMSPSVRADLEQLIAAVESHSIGFDSHGPTWSEDLADRYKKYIPDIPNLSKWFTVPAIGELALLRFLIDETTNGLSKDSALIALSRIVIRVSNQESETRYVSVKKNITPNLTLRAYLASLLMIMRRLETSAMDLQYAEAKFLVGDSRHNIVDQIEENSVDLIVTSPPYPNATDYHLYQRFRLFWLGFDPRNFGKVEIGSHLRHQRNSSGIEEYREEMKSVIQGCARVLQPGRYAVFIVGDALFNGEVFSTANTINEVALEVGLLTIGIIDRPIHQTKRSFASVARRARAEQLVVLQKPNNLVPVSLNPPAYKMWRFEEELRRLEIEAFTATTVTKEEAALPVVLHLRQPELWNIQRLTFTKEYVLGGGTARPTWQKILENGDAVAGRRKDPKYATHGLHAYKGKFYPQLAKSLLNISEAPLGGRVFDPFCGSGTTILEGMLNGYAAYGCDFNPLAAKIARVKTSILCTPRDVADLAMRSLLERVSRPHGGMQKSLNQFRDETHTELLSWFSEPVLYKLNWLLAQARLFGDPALVDFFEIITSSIIREVSHQDPTDLRIRRRKEPLEDAPVLELFRDRLEQQHQRLLKFWSIAGRQPGKLIVPTVQQGDSRTPETMLALQIEANSVDCVVTSPPYATALPYIDTDRLSLLAIMGLASSTRSYLEENLTGSREIRRTEKEQLEAELQLSHANEQLPDEVVRSIRKIYVANNNDEVGFRKANMASLLWRYFVDMRENLSQVANVLKPGAKAFYVVGDSRTNSGGDWVAIETCKHIASIGQMIGLTLKESMPIDVTTENYKHIKNAITENQIIIFEKP